MNIRFVSLIPVTLLTLATPAFARPAPVPQVEKTKDAVVKGLTVAADKTKEGLSKTGEVMTDGWITSRVHQRFVDEELLKGSDIKVDTEKHVVTLTGTVVGRSGRARASAVAMRTEGVHRVINQLTIGPRIKD